MTPEKKTDQAPKPSVTSTDGARKPWIPKSPLEVFLEQATKQEKKVNELQAELDAEKTTVKAAGNGR